jgi:hypothetical protein
MRVVVMLVVMLVITVIVMMMMVPGVWGVPTVIVVLVPFVRHRRSVWHRRRRHETSHARKDYASF